MLMTIVPAALGAATTLATAATVTVPHTILTRPAAAARPVYSRIRTFANSTPRTTFVAGGATAPALGYEGSSALTTNPSLPTAGSVFAEFETLTGVTTQYCQTGSGFGRNVYTGVPGSTAGVNGPCPVLGATVLSSNGFGAPAALGLTAPDLTGTDVPMSQTDYNNYLANRTPSGFGEPVSTPAVIGSIAMLYNNNGITTRVALTDQQICSIVEGKTTNWNQISKKYASLPLFFVYRADGAGTTFSFANHLVDVCTGSGLNVSQTFTAPAPTVSVIGATVPANFVGETGNIGVASEVQAHNGYVGYVETANALAVIGGSVNFATVNGKDPVTNLPETAASLKYNTTDVATDSVVLTTGGPATVVKISPAPAKAGCVAILVPSKYADIKQGYAIISVSNLLFLSAGNGSANATNLRALVTELNTPTDFGPGKITSVDPATETSGTGKTGYSALGATFNKPLKTLGTSCIGA
jgi:ABC-type phosphate transport system substrate-binding protein